MKKSLVVCLAILAASTSGALAAKKGAKSTTPAAAPASPGPMAPPMFGQVTDADRALYMKNQHELGHEEEVEGKRSQVGGTTIVVYRLLRVAKRPPWQAAS